MQIGGIVLAGGKSSRFGKNKCMLPFDNRTLVEIVADTLSIVCSEIIIVAKEQEPYSFTGLPVVTEEDKRQLPLIGLLEGLRGSVYGGNIAAACDMPFLHPDSLKLLVENSKGYDAVIPIINGKPEPLHSFYDKSIVEILERFVHKDDVKLTSFLDEINVRYLNENLFAAHDPQLLSFYNINTEEDYRKALQIAKGSKT